MQAFAALFVRARLPFLVAARGLVGICEPRGSIHLTLLEQSTMQTILSPLPAALALRPREAAKALGISPRTLWGLTVPRGPIPCLRVGHGKRQTVLYPVADLQAWLSQQAEAMKGDQQ